MEYLSLYKAGFINDINEKELYNKRFNAPNTIHFPIEVNEKSSFLYLNSELLSLLEQIQILNTRIIKKRFEASTDLIDAWELYHSLTREIMITNEIEGIASTRKEITELLETKKPKEYKRLYGLVNKYRDILLKSKEFVPITDSSKLREVYNDILIQDIEKNDPNNIPDGLIFRRDIVNIVSSTKTIHKGIYPESKVIEAVDSALKILNDNKLPCILRVAIFHYFLGYIHPFYDGNGRISRYISSYYLSQTLDPIVALRLSIACKNRQKDYYEAFKITNDTRNLGDITCFVLLFLDIFKDGLEEYLDDLTDKIDRYNYYHNKVLEIGLDKSDKSILNIIIDYTLFYLKDVDLATLVDVTKLSKSTVSKRLGILEEKELIIRKKEGRKTTFAFNLEAY